jgi:hypothetical protein
MSIVVVMVVLVDTIVVLDGGALLDVAILSLAHGGVLRTRGSCGRETCGACGAGAGHGGGGAGSGGGGGIGNIGGGTTTAGILGGGGATVVGRDAAFGLGFAFLINAHEPVSHVMKLAAIEFCSSICKQSEC